MLHNQNSVCAVLVENEWVRGLFNAWFSAHAIITTFFNALSFVLLHMHFMKHPGIIYAISVGGILGGFLQSDQIAGNLDFSFCLGWLWQSELNLHECHKEQHLILHIHTHKHIYKTIYKWSQFLHLHGKTLTIGKSLGAENSSAIFRTYFVQILLQFEAHCIGMFWGLYQLWSPTQ